MPVIGARSLVGSFSDFCNSKWMTIQFFTDGQQEKIKYNVQYMLCMNIANKDQ